MAADDFERLKRSCQVGDRVLAPWEPDFLYPGSIAQIEGIQILVDLDNGDTGWVLVDQLRPLVIQRGQKVECRQKSDLDYLAAEVLDSRPNEVHVTFGDEQSEEWTTFAALRVPCEPNGPAAISVEAASDMAFTENVKVGDRVWAPWQGNLLFAGTVERIIETEVHVVFDDGDQGLVRREQLKPLDIQLDMRVLGRWKMGSEFYPGSIDEIQDERVHIQFDNGDREWTKLAAVALPSQRLGPDARPMKSANGWHSLPGWVIPVAIAIGLAILRALLR